MKRWSLFLILFTNTLLFCQSNSFSGSIMYTDKVNKELTLDFTIDSIHQVTGNSYRIDRNGKGVNHFLSGYFELKEQLVYLKEYARSKNDCPIYIQARVYHLFDNIYTIAGLFQSIDSTKCDKGHINVITRDFKFNLLTKKDTAKRLSEQEEELILSRLLENKVRTEKEFITVNANEKIEIKSDGKPIYLKIYDQLKIDGDKVRISFNNEVIAREITLSEKPEILKLNPKLGKNTLVIFALNEGKIAMNTSKVEIYNDSLNEFFINMLYKNQNTTYVFHY